MTGSRINDAQFWFSVRECSTRWCGKDSSRLDIRVFPDLASFLTRVFLFFIFSCVIHTYFIFLFSFGTYVLMLALDTRTAASSSLSSGFAQNMKRILFAGVNITKSKKSPD